MLMMKISSHPFVFFFQYWHQYDPKRFPNLAFFSIGISINILPQ